MYKSDDFGSIKNTARGLAVTENASLTTISIALMLADETMGHKPLVINGSPDFHKKAMEAALTANLPISFQDKMMQREFERKKERIENERKNSLQVEEELSPNAQILSPILRQLMQSQSKMQPKSDFACQWCGRTRKRILSACAIRLAFENRGGCIFHSHHLPKWAHDTPKFFSKQPINTKASAIAVTEKLNLPCLTS